MFPIKKTFAAVAAAAVLLTGCGSGEDETESEARYPATPYSRSVSEPQTGVGGDREIARMALILAWDDMAPSQQEDICWAWDTLGSDYVVDQFMDKGGREMGLENSDARTFFGSKC